MDANPIKTTHPLALAAGVAVILFCGAGIAAIMGWIPTSIGSPGEASLPAKTAAASSAPAAVTHADAAPVRRPPTQVAAAPVSRSRCTECGVVESVREVEKAGSASGAGAVAGGLTGAVVGHQMGSGRGRDAMTVIGAVGGALAGNQIEKNVKTTRVHEVVVRFEDGSTRVFSQSDAPSWRPGDRVRVVDGAVRSDS